MNLPRSLQGRLLALVLATVSVVWLAASAITWSIQPWSRRVLMRE